MQGQAAVKVPTCNGHQYGPQSHVQPGLELTPVSSVSNPNAAFSTDIYSATDPRPGFTAKHAVTAPFASDVSTTAADAATAAGDSTTSPNSALYTVTAANTTAAAANTKTSADIAAAAHTTAAAASTNCPKFTVAAHTTTQPTNITAASLAEDHLLPAVGHITNHYSHRD